MKFGSIQGAVKGKPFQNWIQLSSVSFGASRPSSTMAGQGSEGRHKDLPDVSPIRVTKEVDIASTALMRNSIGAQPVAEVLVVYAEQGVGTELQKVLELKLGEVLLSDYSCSIADTGGYESMTLTYALLEWEYQHHDEKGGTKPFRAGYDMLTAKPQS
jgi:type VI protein secretion system component Hcp